jgi:hypothetical protein
MKPRNNKEAKAHYRAVENTTTMGCNAKKRNNKQSAQNGGGNGLMPLLYIELQ